MLEFVTAEGGHDVKKLNAVSLPPVVCRYLQTCLKPALGEALSVRNRHEMETLAEGIDSLLRGELVAGLTVFFQRFKSLETVSYEGNWEKAKQLELVKRDKVTCVSPRENELARANLLQSRRLNFQESRPRGDGATRSKKGFGHSAAGRTQSSPTSEKAPGGLSRSFKRRGRSRGEPTFQDDRGKPKVFDARKEDEESRCGELGERVPGRQPCYRDRID